MKKIFIRIVLFFSFFRCSFHLLLFYFHPNKRIIRADIQRWCEILHLNYSPTLSLLYLLSFFPEFRNLFYHRVGYWKLLPNLLCPKLSTLYIATKKIGKGLFIQHGFSTIIAAVSIGENCWINQQVTIGFSNDNDCPTLGNNVSVFCGAKVIGKLTIGNNSMIGANALVIKNVPENCTVIGVPGCIVKRDGVKVNEAL